MKFVHPYIVISVHSYDSIYSYKYLECNHTFIEKNPFACRYKQDTRASNGFTEGCNNSIKVLKRISYGLRNFDRFRGRILLLSKKDKKE